MQDQFNILVVDDEPGIRITMAGILEDEGYNVIMVEDGYKGIVAAENTNFKIAFIDMRMPGINGIETFKKIKKISPDTIIFFMTAFLGEEALDEASKLGAQTILYKPLDFELILKILNGNLARTNILIVDDEFSICKMLQKMLEDRGYYVCIATNGHTAIQKAKIKHFDIMFMDVVMPGIDGFQTLEVIKKINPVTNVIMMSGKDIENFAEQVESLGAFAYITKPFDLVMLLQLTVNAIKEN